MRTRTEKTGVSEIRQENAGITAVSWKNILDSNGLVD